MAIYSYQKPIKLIISCEHASNAVPLRFKNLFDRDQEILKTHRGYDIGALSVAKKLAEMADFSVFGKVSRLLIDLNRSLHHRKAFSEFSNNLSIFEKIYLIEKYYQPYREALVKQIDSDIAQDFFVFHISVHSFTPIFNEVTRTTDIGLLYDPKNSMAVLLTKAIDLHFRQLTRDYRIRFNYPYRGISDGFTTYLRRCYAEEQYCGIEIEMNQKLFANPKFENKPLAVLFTSVLRQILYT